MIKINNKLILSLAIFVLGFMFTAPKVLANNVNYMNQYGNTGNGANVTYSYVPDQTYIPDQTYNYNQYPTYNNQYPYYQNPNYYNPNYYNQNSYRNNPNLDYNNTAGTNTNNNISATKNSNGTSKVASSKKTTTKTATTTKDPALVGVDATLDEYGNALSANALFASNGFMPTNFFQWLLVFLIILALVFLWRKLYVTSEERHAPLKHA